MGILDNFRSKDFMDQMRILAEIEKSENREAIPQLLDLHAVPMDNDSIAFMVEETLHSLLSKNEEATIDGLTADCMSIKKLCVQVAGKNRMVAAGKTLVQLAEKEENAGILLEILTAIAELKDPGLLEIFNRYIHHKDSLVSALSIKQLGEQTNSTSFDTLCDIIREGESDEKFENCSISEYKAIETLGTLKTEPAFSFLSRMIHHRSVRARRIIHSELVKAGPPAIPFLTGHFKTDNDDMKIMAAAILGQIGDRTAVDSLVNAVTQGFAGHHNVRQAIYEALGKIPSPDGAECLMADLDTDDEILLMSVIASLNSQNSQTISEKISDLILRDNRQSERLISAIVQANALSIFEALYPDETIGDKMIDCITRLNDPEIISEFYVKLVAIGGERAEADAEKIEHSAIHEIGKTILAVDNSMPMLLFYRKIAADLHIDIITAANGQEGLEKIEKNRELDLVLTDMNMPVMDGIEFSKKVREIPEMADLPILMATTESDKSQEKQALSAGVSCFVMKPFTADTIQKKIRELLGLEE